MTTVYEWISADHRRQAPEFDFGTQWTREHDPHTEWAVTYNTGTGELYARTRTGTDVEVLGQFADPQDVAAALPDWGRRSQQAGSLDWARREALAVSPTQPEVAPDLNDEIYGIAVNTDGTTIAFRERQNPGKIAVQLDTGDLDVAVVNTGDRTDRVVMWVDDRSNDHVLPVNAAATQIYGTGWPILGNAVIVTDNQQPLPPGLVRDLISDLDHADPFLAHDVDDAALEWDDRLDLSDAGVLDPADLDDDIALSDPTTAALVDDIGNVERWNALHQVLEHLEDPEHHHPDLQQDIDDTRSILADLDPDDHRIDTDTLDRLPDDIRDYIDMNLGADHDIAVDDDMGFDL